MEVMAFCVYTAGPVDGISADEAGGWRDELVSEFPEVLFYRPDRAFGNAHARTAAPLDYINRGVIMHCSGVVANLSGPGRGFGTIREIEFARAHNRRVAIVTDDRIDEGTLLVHDLDMHSTPAAAMQSLLTWMTDAVSQPPQVPHLGFLFGGGGEQE